MRLSMRTILSFFNRNHIVFQNLVSTECFIPKTTSAISPIINIINGTAISQKLKNALRDELQTILIKEKPKIHSKPCLACILVGDRADSHLYVKLKQRACEYVGIDHIARIFPANVSQNELLLCIKECVLDKRINGILLQLPLPRALDEEELISAISPEKDVDGIHPFNKESLAAGENGSPLFIPCAPKACMYLLHQYLGSTVYAKEAVVIGQSCIVGTPMGHLLTQAGLNVRTVDITTPKEEIEVITSQGDIVVVGIGDPSFVKGNWIKSGAMVLDVGINEVKDLQGRRRVVGDVEFKEAQKRASWITPVPGGVGPVTIAMLMKNVVNSWKRVNYPTEENIYEKLI